MKKQYIPIQLFLIITATNIYSMEPIIQFPTASTIKNNLEMSGYQNFVASSNIDKKLANQKRKTLGIVLAVDQLVNEYNKKNKDLINVHQISNKKIIEIIFKNNTQAMYYLDQALY